MLPRTRSGLQNRKNGRLCTKLKKLRRAVLCAALLSVAGMQFWMHARAGTGSAALAIAALPARPAADAPPTEAVEHWIYRRTPSRGDGAGAGARDGAPAATPSSRTVPGNKIFVTSPLRIAADVAADTLARAPPGFELHAFNNSAMARSVRRADRVLARELGLRGAWKAWSALRPWAYRADLWRLLILWSEGGVYLDSKMRLTAPLEDWAALGGAEQLVVCRDDGMTWQSSAKRPSGPPPQGNHTTTPQQPRGSHAADTRTVPVLWTGAMAAPRRSRVLAEAIRRLVANVESRAYSLLGEEDRLPRHDYRTLAITGPVLVGYVASLFDEEADGAGATAPAVVRTPCGFYHQQGGVLYRDPHRPGPSRRGLLMTLDQDDNRRVHDAGNVYRFLHRDGRVYCDDGGGGGGALPVGEDNPCDVAALLAA